MFLFLRLETVQQYTRDRVLGAHRAVGFLAASRAYRTPRIQLQAVRLSVPKFVGHVSFFHSRDARHWRKAWWTVILVQLGNLSH